MHDENAASDYLDWVCGARLGQLQQILSIKETWGGGGGEI